MVTQLSRPINSCAAVRSPAPAVAMEQQWVKRFMPREFAQQRGVHLKLMDATIVA